MELTCYDAHLLLMHSTLLVSCRLALVSAPVLSDGRATEAASSQHSNDCRLLFLAIANEEQGGQRGSGEGQFKVLTRFILPSPIIGISYCATEGHDQCLKRNSGPGCDPCTQLSLAGPLPNTCLSALRIDGTLLICTQSNDSTMVAEGISIAILPDNR